MVSLLYGRGEKLSLSSLPKVAQPVRGEAYGLFPVLGA